MKNGCPPAKSLFPRCSEYSSLSFSFHSISHFFPCFLPFCPFPLFIHSLSWTKPDHWHAADVIVATETEVSQQRGCAEMVRSGEKVTMGQLFKNPSSYHLFKCLRVRIWTVFFPDAKTCLHKFLSDTSNKEDLTAKQVKTNPAVVRHDI